MPHGAVIDLELFQKVQQARSSIRETRGYAKNTGDGRVYPLSGGLLIYEDGTPFAGITGNGKTSKCHYYRNRHHKVAIPVDILEADVRQMVSKLIQSSTEVQRAIQKAGQNTKDQIQLLTQECQSLKDSKVRLQRKRDELFTVLSKMVASCDSPEQVRFHREEFERQIGLCDLDSQSVDRRLRDIEGQLANLSATAFSWKDIAKHAERVQKIMTDKDPVALKGAYRDLFAAIVVGQEDDLGVRQVRYVLRDQNEDPAVNIHRGVRIRSRMVETVGVEPTSESDLPSESTCLAGGFD